MIWHSRITICLTHHVLPVQGRIVNHESLFDRGTRERDFARLHSIQLTTHTKGFFFLLTTTPLRFDQACLVAPLLQALPHPTQLIPSVLHTKMPPGQMLEPSETESDFVVSCLSDGVRPDGRSFLSTRDVDISFGEELGNCTVAIKGTRVSTCVRATLMPPRSDRPYEGFLQITTDISPMAGIEYDSTGGGANSSARAREVLFDRLIDKAVRRTEAVDREALCVVAGEQVWNVHLTVHLLSDTGAALDAAVLCSMLSLRHFRRPDYSIENGNQVRLYSLDERVPVPLAIHHTPLCVTFAIFNHLPSISTAASKTQPEDRADSHLIDPNAKASSPDTSTSTSVALLDPTLLEESLAQSKLTLVLNAQREICVLDKSYGSPIDAHLLLHLIQIGLIRIQQLTERLEHALSVDAETRVVEVI